MPGRRGKENSLLLSRKIIVPRKFSELISSHGSAVTAETGFKRITPHQILDPDFNPVSPKLKVKIPGTTSNFDFNSTAQQQIGPVSQPFSQQLPARKPFISRALRKQTSAADDDFEDYSATDTEQVGRKTILELEAQLIQERQQLKRLQLEADTKKKVYAKTTRQMQARLIENQQKAKMLLDTVKQARTGLEKLESATNSAEKSNNQTSIV